MPRRRLIILLVVGTVALLFLGRWTVLALSELWWASAISPAAGRVLGQAMLLQVLLDLAGTVIASVWFMGNLYMVYRAIGSVQVPRRVANLEIHEALTPRALVALTLGIGVVLGILAGAGVSQWWPQVLLAWHGVSYGLTDPVLQNDIGVYVAQLPLWRRLHWFALLLVLLAFGLCVLLYVLLGAIRWIGRRPAVSDHVRRHLGWLLAAVALVLAWGYWLEPYEMVAGLGGSIRSVATGVRVTVAFALMGVALSTAVLSAWWAIRPRHGWLAAGWMVLILASLLGHYVVPGLAGVPGQQLLDDEGVRRVERLAYGLDRLEELPLRLLAAGTSPPGPLTLWSLERVRQLGAGDSSEAVSANPSLLRIRGMRVPVWVTLRLLPSDSVEVIAYAADRTSLTGGPLSYRADDTLAYPGSVAFSRLPRPAVRPDAPEFALTEGPVGVRVGSWAHRLVLGWARQAGVVFGAVPDSAHLAWHLSPVERLSALVPHVAWGPPSAILVDGELYWLLDGYAPSGTFPIVDRAPWREREVAALEVPFLALIEAVSGQVRVFRRPGVNPLGRAWQEILGAAAEPWTQLPRVMGPYLQYPSELFQLQGRVLERQHWLGLRQAGRPGAQGSPRLDPLSWQSRDTVPQLVSAFEAPGGRGVTAVVLGRAGGAGLHLILVRLRPERPLPGPVGLTRSWERFATREQLEDSLRSAGAQAEPAPVGLWLDQRGLGAYQTVIGVGPENRSALAWVNLAVADSLGAGRSVPEAWQNLLGTTAPLVAGTPGRLAEAERWMLVADSALKRGDWTTFGRAFEALREVLQTDP